MNKNNIQHNNLHNILSFVYGNPFLAKTPDTTETTSGFRTPNAPGIGQQLLGLGLSGLNVFGMGGGFGGNLAQINISRTRRKH